MKETKQNNSQLKPLGLAGKISRLFLTNTELSILTIIVLAVWGIISFILMPKQYNPEIVAPAFAITTEFPGASSSEVYELVTRPMEDTLFELPDVDEISSQSIPGGRSIVTVKFFVGSNRENAKIALNQKLRDHMNEKPRQAEEPVIQSVDPDDVPILDIGLSSDTLSESSLRKLAFDVSDKLKLVDGVSKVDIKGGRTNNLEVNLDAQKLAALNISVSEILGALSTQNDIFTFDAFKQESFDPIINVSGNIRSKEELSQLVVRDTTNSIIRLGDIATVTYGPGEINDYVRHSEKDGTDNSIVHIALSKLKGKNSTATSSAVLEKIDSFHGNLIPSEVNVDILNDEGKTASDEIGKLTFDLGKSILIVGLLLFIFLGARNSLVASISIPLVLLAVFGVGLLFGQTVNRITLFALILSLGLLVDDAIVVVENIARYFRLYPNESRIKLVTKAVDEVGGALGLSTLTMALAFVPMAFVTGMMGPYMGPIPFFVPTALFASLLFAVTINPFLALVFNRKKDNRTEVSDHSYESGIFFRAIKWIEQRYADFLRKLLTFKEKRRLFLGVVLILLLISIALPLSPLVPFRMLPKADKDQFSVYLDLPNGTDVKTTDAISKEMEEIILQEPEIISVDSFVGQSPVMDFNGLFKGSDTRVMGNQASFKAHLTPHEERNETSEEIASSLREHLSSISQKHPDAIIRLMEDPPGPPVLATFLLKVKGDDEKTLEQIALDMKRFTSNITSVVDIDTSLPEHGLNFSYRIDREKASMLGIAPTSIANTLHAALSGSSVGLYHESVQENLRKAEQEHIIVRFAPEYRDNIQDLSLIQITTSNGSSVPLSEILIQTNDTVDTTILSDDREKSVYISGEMEGRSIIYAVIDLFPALLRYTLPDGNGSLLSWSLLGAEYRDSATGQNYHVEIGGEWKLTLEVFRDLGIAMGLAIFLIYFVLATKSESLFVPLLIMVSIPLSLIGVLPGFALLHAIKGTYFNATSMIGVIALAGLAVKNGVIYLEYLEPLKASGKNIIEALIEAGRIRLLPILLTSLAAILGSFTIASDPVWEGLAWSIIFGLTASTVLTLVVFPVIYFIFERKHWEEK